MSNESQTSPTGRVAILRWTARMGAVTAEALATSQGLSVASARARLHTAVRAGLLVRQRPLLGPPALYTATRAGLRACGEHGLDPCRITASNALHAIACAEVAAALERCYPDHRLVSERELRRDERESCAVLASASLRIASPGGGLLHRPDLVLWPDEGSRELPVAVEVELTLKAPRRLAEICLAWARCRRVAGVLYLAAPGIERALWRAIETAQAGERIAVVPLGALPILGRAREASAERGVPSGT